MSERPANLDALLDARSGVIRRLRRDRIPATIPSQFRLITAELSDTARFSPWTSDTAGAGYALLDEDSAVGPAIGEAIERYCGNLVPDGLLRATRADLLAAGVDVLDPRRHVLFADHQYRGRRFPFVPFTDDLTLEWATGTDLTTGADVLVPANLVWISYAHAAPARGVPFLNPALVSGLAAGIGESAAQWSALTQMIERDTITLAWQGRRRLREIAPPAWLARLGRGRQGTMSTRFLEFPNDFGLVVAGALVHDAATGYLTLGTACRPTTEAALRKSLAEAFQLQMFVAEFDDPASAYMRAANEPASPLKPWRADRRYLDDCRPDLADVVEYCTHLQLYLDPRLQRRLNSELDRAVDGTVTPAELDASTGRIADGHTAELVRRLGRLGHRVVAVDVTTDDVRPTGLRVTHAFVDGLYSNTAAAFPFLGGTRLPALLSPTGQSRRDLPLPH